jgi:multidrug resistance efflux pump
MPSKWRRLGLLTGGAILLATAFAWAQDRRTGARAEADRVNVFNSVEGRAVVVASRPEGARVEEGEIVCELDPTELKDRLAAQQLATRGAQADVHGTRLAREVAALAVLEYKDGTFTRDFVTAQGQIKLAESNLSRAEDNLDWCRRMFEKGYVSMAEKTKDELALKTARFALEQAQLELKVLVDYSKDRTIKELTGAVETARARELAKQADLEMARLAERRLSDQIARCKVAAPARGRVEYPAPIGPGAVIRDGQLLFRLSTDGTINNKNR